MNTAFTVLGHLTDFVAGSAAEASADEGFNAAISTLEAMNHIQGLPVVGVITEESSALVDIVGYNYGDVRWRPDHEAHPDWVFVGSETLPSRIDKLWADVKELDYLGESGIGRVKYPDEAGAFDASYRWLTTSSGDIDITGHRRAVSYYREVVFGLRADPYLVV